VQRVQDVLLRDQALHQGLALRRVLGRQQPDQAARRERDRRRRRCLAPARSGRERVRSCWSLLLCVAVVEDDMGGRTNSALSCFLRDVHSLQPSGQNAPLLAYSRAKKGTD